jgi:WD40 repeat protein
METIAQSSDIVNSLPQGIRFSPDGLCLLTSVRDELRLYNTSTGPPSSDQQPAVWKTALTCRGGDVVQDFDWYPHMKSSDPGTCCFLGTSRDQPAHLYDAYTGAIRASYCPYHPDREEADSPLVTRFDATGSKIICGGFQSDRYLAVFDISRPGKQASTIYRLGKTKRSQDGQKGLISAISCAPDSPHVMAVGTYSPGSIYLYDTRVAGDHVATILSAGAGLAVVGHGKRFKARQSFANADDDDGDDDDSNLFSRAKAQWFQRRAQSGITQLAFCNNSNMLLSASRKSDAVLNWDVRVMTSATGGDTRPVAGVKSYAANHNTNQRLEFHVDTANGATSNKLYIGDRDKTVKVYDIASGDLLETIVMQDTVNGVSVHSDHVAVSLGERRFVEDEDMMVSEGSIQLWRQK